MRKQVFGRKFKRDSNERKALFNGLISSMIMYGKISTTEEKAKSIRADLEKMVTKAKKEEINARRLLSGSLKKHELDKMISDIAPRFKNRAGGYTRIVRAGNRFNDNASMVIMEWVEGEAVAHKVEAKESKKEAKPKEVKAKAVKGKTVKKPAKKTEGKTK